MKKNIVQLMVSLYHRQLGGYVATYPYYFLFIPLLLSVALSAGILFITAERDYELLFTPQNSQAHENRRMIESIFPMNTSSNFDMTKMTRSENLVSIIILPKDGGSILRRHIFSEIAELNRIVQNSTIVVNGKAWNYSMLCAKNDGECTENVVLDLESNLDRFHKGTFRFKYPFDLDRTTFKVTPYAMNLGGITTDEDGYVENSKAFRLFYYFDNSNENIRIIAQQWETLVRNVLQETLFPNINIVLLSYLSVKSEISQYTAESVHIIGMSAALMIAFSMLSCMTTNWIRSKPWLGLAGCVSTGLAMAATFGTIGYCGNKYADVVIALPFLMIGLGMDDSFVLLSAWRRTDTCKSVKERLSEAYSEAAVSITITSLANFLSFCLGVATPFPIVQIFCIYAATAVVFTYLFQITFFGGCMALSGFREHRHLHPFTFTPVVSKGYSTEDTFDEKRSDDITMRLFRDKLGVYITKPLTKGCIYILLLLLLGTAIWGHIIMEEGLDAKDVLHPDSNGLKFVKLNDKYFPEFAVRVHVVINTTLNYANTEIQEKLENITRKFESSPYIAEGLLTESWLRFYLLMSQRPPGKFLLSAFDLSEKQDFVDGLANVFLKFPQTKRLRSNLIFNENYTEIIASRFFFTCTGLTTKSSQRQVLEHVRKIVEESDIPMITHSLYFLFNEQLLAVKAVFLQTIGTAAVVILIIFFVFIPDIKCALCVAATVVAVEIETIGYMSLWGVNLDILSMINLVMCVGFSINYPAHIAYAYITSSVNDENERLKMALYAAGMPIFQSSFSTILGVATLAFVPSYTLLVFLKSVFLIVAASFLHAIFVLPIMLNFCECCCRRKHGNSGNNSVSFVKINSKYQNVVSVDCNIHQISSDDSLK